MKDGCMAKPGWFPADHVVLIDNTGKVIEPAENRKMLMIVVM